MNKHIAAWFEQHAGEVTALSDSIFREPELGLDTFASCRKSAEFMRKHGFDVTELNVAGRGGQPNGHIAKFGSGKPVIGILGELDALPGLGQEPVPVQSPIPPGKPGPGHGCGHHLMASGPAAAAVALKAAMEADNIPGTIVYYACPAEETLDGKVYMARDGLFDELDFCVAWHPMGESPSPTEASMAANCSIYFNFYGKTAHAAANPQDGRSALDAAELMSVGVNYLREHVPDGIRVHYSYVNAGEKPNIVPDFARVHYYVRGESRDIVDEVLERVKACAEGAAIMTGTRTDNELFAICCETFINHRANRLMYEAAKQVPEIEYTPEEMEFARTIFRNYTGRDATHDLLPTKLREPLGVVTRRTDSSDVGDVSHIVPTVQLFGGGEIVDLPEHHWTTTATTGSSIGHKAELHAGKILAQTCLEALLNPGVIEEMWAEFREARKDMKPYKPGLPE